MPSNTKIDKIMDIYTRAQGSRIKPRISVKKVIIFNNNNFIDFSILSAAV